MNKLNQNMDSWREVSHKKNHSSKNPSSDGKKVSLPEYGKHPLAKSSKKLKGSLDNERYKEQMALDRLVPPNLFCLNDNLVVPEIDKIEAAISAILEKYANYTREQVTTRFVRLLVKNIFDMDPSTWNQGLSVITHYAKFTKGVDVKGYSCVAILLWGPGNYQGKRERVRLDRLQNLSDNRQLAGKVLMELINLSGLDTQAKNRDGETLYASFEKTWSGNNPTFIKDDSIIGIIEKGLPRAEVSKNLILSINIITSSNFQLFGNLIKYGASVEPLRKVLVKTLLGALLDSNSTVSENGYMSYASALLLLVDSCIDSPIVPGMFETVLRTEDFNSSKAKKSVYREIQRQVPDAFLLAIEANTREGEEKSKNLLALVGAMTEASVKTNKSDDLKKFLTNNPDPKFVVTALAHILRMCPKNVSKFLDKGLLTNLQNCEKGVRFKLDALLTPYFGKKDPFQSFLKTLDTPLESQMSVPVNVISLHRDDIKEVVEAGPIAETDDRWLPKFLGDIERDEADLGYSKMVLTTKLRTLNLTSQQIAGIIHRVINEVLLPEPDHMDKQLTSLQSFMDETFGRPSVAKCLQSVSLFARSYTEEFNSYWETPERLRAFGVFMSLYELE